MSGGAIDGTACAWWGAAMADVLVVLIVFSVPLSAIVGNLFLKYKKLELEKGGGRVDDARLLKLERDNAELRGRVETLETIATGMSTGQDPRVAGIDASLKLRELEQQMAQAQEPVSARR